MALVRRRIRARSRWLRIRQQARRNGRARTMVLRYFRRRNAVRLLERRADGSVQVWRPYGWWIPLRRPVRSNMQKMTAEELRQFVQRDVARLQAAEQERSGENSQ